MWVGGVGTYYFPSSMAHEYAPGWSRSEAKGGLQGSEAISALSIQPMCEAQMVGRKEAQMGWKRRKTISSENNR